MKRTLAAQLTEIACPRCGTIRAPEQAYCLECGLALPLVVGPLARWRRGWLRAVGWYPGDWAWRAIPLFLIAAAGAAAAVLVGRSHGSAAVSTYVAAAPSLPAVTSPAGANGRTLWPAQLDGWTVVIQSSPAGRGRSLPLAVAKRAAHDGLPQVGVLDSSAFASLHPGYLVVFSGVYSAPGDAQTALETVRARGFGGAYVLRVAA